MIKNDIPITYILSDIALKQLTHEMWGLLISSCLFSDSVSHSPCRIWRLGRGSPPRTCSSRPSDPPLLRISPESPRSWEVQALQWPWGGRRVCPASSPTRTSRPQRRPCCLSSSAGRNVTAGLSQLAPHLSPTIKKTWINKSPQFPPEVGQRWSGELGHTDSQLCTVQYSTVCTVNCDERAKN